ncbi:MAG: M23 family metallopeptidase [Armatimonadetes bacterium]|nr:M23 family metallopeptidase [Armatimonadota bacterium]
MITAKSDTAREIAHLSATVGAQHPVFFQIGEVYKALVGLRAGTRPGAVPVSVKVGYEGGGEKTATVQLRVASRLFPTQHLRISPSKAGLMEAGLLERERILLYSHLTSTRAQPLWKGKFLVPASGRNTSSFGRRRYVNGKWWGQHSGADIACSAGTRVVADNDGVVVLAEKLKMRGNTIVIDHGFNLFTLYNHLSGIQVREGESVKKGQVVGRVGATGFVTGPHLHWEIRVGVIPVNPWSWTKSEVPL